MTAATDSSTLCSRVIETSYVEWRTFQYIQQDDFKELSKEAKSRLRTSISENNFTQPFYVWRDPESQIIYCLDGRHRAMVLEEMITDGCDIPEKLPATFIECADKKEAARLVLIYSSMYAKVSEAGFQDFITLYDLNPQELSEQIDLPGINYKFEVAPPTDPFDDQGVGLKNQYGVIVMCANEEEQERVYTSLTNEGLTCKIVVT